MYSETTSSAINQRLRNILLPVTTPFQSKLAASTKSSESESLDEDGFRLNIKKWSKSGIGGIVVLGSTGERVHLDEREYLRVIDVARSEVSNDLAFIAGAGQQSTRGTIVEVEKAAHAGADAVLVITPHFYRAAITQEALTKYYTAVADASPVPVLLYSMPALTGVKIEPATIARLSQHENIVGAKDSSADIEGFKETVRLCPDDFAVMTGNGTVLLDTLKAGATGGILAVGCAVPEICVEIFKAFKAGKDERAAVLQAKLTPLVAAVTTRFGIGGLKAALDMSGYKGGEVRAPLRSSDEIARAEIARLLDDARATFASLNEEAGIRAAL